MTNLEILERKYAKENPEIYKAWKNLDFKKIKGFAENFSNRDVFYKYLDKLKILKEIEKKQDEEKLQKEIHKLYREIEKDKILVLNKLPARTKNRLKKDLKTLLIFADSLILPKKVSEAKYIIDTNEVLDSLIDIFEYEKENFVPKIDRKYRNLVENAFLEVIKEANGAKKGEQFQTISRLALLLLIFAISNLFGFPIVIGKIDKKELEKLRKDINETRRYFVKFKLDSGIMLLLIALLIKLDVMSSTKDVSHPLVLIMLVAMIIAQLLAGRMIIKSIVEFRVPKPAEKPTTAKKPRGFPAPS